MRPEPSLRKTLLTTHAGQRVAEYYAPREQPANTEQWGKRPSFTHNPRHDPTEEDTRRIEAAKSERTRKNAKRLARHPPI